MRIVFFQDIGMQHLPYLRDPVEKGIREYYTLKSAVLGKVLWTGSRVSRIHHYLKGGRRMKHLGVCLSLLVLVSLSYGNDWQVWRQTDWSHGWWCFENYDDTSAFGWDERIDFWSNPGQFSLSSWVGITLGDSVEWGCPWGYWSDGISVFLELPDGTLLGSGAGQTPICRSTDGGDTWVKTTGIPGGATYNMIRTYDGTLFADLLVGIPHKGYVYRSTDDGVSWILDWDLTKDLGEWCVVGALIEFKDSTIIATVLNCYLVAERSKETGEWEVRTVFEDGMYLTRPYLYLEDEDILYIRGVKKPGGHWQDIFFRSTDRGYTWEEVREGFAPWLSLIQGQDGTFYGSTFGPYILRSEDRGETWDSIANLADPSARSTHIRCLLQTRDGTFYAGVEEGYGWGPSPCRVKSSTDGGYTWQDELFFYDYWAAWWPLALFENSEENLFLGTDFHDGIAYGIGCQIWKKTKITGYNCFGHLGGAPLFDGPMEWGTIDWDCDKNGGNIKVKVRSRWPSGTNAEEALGWFEYVEKGQDVSELPHVFNGDRTIHYLVELYPPETCDHTPVFHEIRIECREYVGMEEERASLAGLTGLAVVPNPFDDHSAIRYGLPKQTHVRLNVYDLNGRLIRTLTDEEQKVGYHEVLWDGRNDAGVSVGTGVYFLKFETDAFKETKKLLILK